MISLLYLTAGVALMMGFLQFSLFRKENETELYHRYYAFSILSIVPYVILTSMIYQSPDAGSIVGILRIQMFFSNFLMIMYLRFIAHFTNQVHKGVLAGFTATVKLAPPKEAHQPALVPYSMAIAFQA